MSTIKKWIVPVLAVLVYCFSPTRSHAQADTYQWQQTSGTSATAKDDTAFCGQGGCYSGSLSLCTFGIALWFHFTDKSAGWWTQSTQAFGGAGFPAGAMVFDGPINGGSGEEWAYNLDLTQAPWVLFGPADEIDCHLQGQDGSQQLETGMIGETTTGQTLCEVAGTKDGGKTWVPIVGAQISLYNTLSGTNEYSGDSTLSRAGTDGHQHSFLVFGKESGDTTKKIDCVYAPGFAYQQYQFHAKYLGAELVGTLHTGAQWPGKAELLLFGLKADGTIDPSGTNQVMDTDNGGALPLTGCSLTACTSDAPSSSTTGGDTTNNPFDPTNTVAAIKQMFLDLFTPQQSDIDALKAAATQLMGWGPFSIPPQVIALYQSTLGSTNLDDSDPTYWYLNLNAWNNPVGLGNSMPTGYHGYLTDPDETSDVQTASHRWDGFFPDHLDLARYRREVVAGRSIGALLLWGMFIYALIVLVKPRINL